MLIDNLYQLDYIGVSSWERDNDADQLKGQEHHSITSVVFSEKYDEDITALCSYAGLSALPKGMTINITLQEILKICPRKRHRIDSYSTLVRYLREQLGVELVITSNKTKNNGKENL